MSKLNINLPTDICYFKDPSVSLNFEFVKGCESKKQCINVDIDPYTIYTCQTPQVLIKGLGSTCYNNYECIFGHTCTTGNKCCPTGGCPDTNSISDTGCNTGEIYNYKVETSPICQSGINKKLCKTYDSPGTDDKLTGYYKEDNYAKICGKNTIDHYDDNKFYRKSIEWVYYGSVADGEFVEDPEACQSGYALYFYGNNELTNPLGSDSGTHEMFLRCVSVLDVELETTIIDGETKSSCKRIKYKIGSGSELIYDLSNLDATGKSISNCDYLLMTKLKMFKNYKEEYDKVKDQCYSSKSSDNLCGKDELMKWWYLYQNPRDYVLYKDQTEVLDYLIQKANPNKYTPETGKVPETTPVTEPAAITEETTTEPETESSEFLNIKYFIFLLFGLFEL